MDKQPESHAFEIEVDFAPLPEAGQTEPAATDGNVAAHIDDEAPTPALPAPTAVAEPTIPAPKASILATLRNNLPLLLAGLGIFSSLIAAIGLIVVSRNVAESNQRIAALQEALQRASSPPAPTTHAVPARGEEREARSASVDEVKAMLFAFRRDIAAYQNSGGGNAAWLNAMRDSQAELANRFNTIAEKVDRIDRRINGSRPASPADDRARPS